LRTSLAQKGKSRDALLAQLGGISEIGMASVGQGTLIGFIAIAEQLAIYGQYSQIHCASVAKAQTAE